MHQLPTWDQVRQHPYFAPASLFLLALALRLWGIGSESIWTDEMATLRRAQMGLEELLENTSTHGQLPLYFGLLNLWVKVAGTDEAALRLPSAIIGSLNVLLAYHLIHSLLRHPRARTGTRTGVGTGPGLARGPEPAAPGRSGHPDRKGGVNSDENGRYEGALEGLTPLHLGRLELPWPLIGALLVATNPILIYMGQDARTYTLLLMASWLMALAVLVPLHWQRPLQWRESCMLALGLLILAASHYIGWVIALGVLVILIIHRQELSIRVNWRLSLGPILVPLVWVAGWLSYMQVTGNWPNTDFHESSTIKDNLADFGEEHLTPALLVIAPILVACGSGYRAFKNERNPLAQVCLLWVLAIIVAVLAMSAYSNSYFVARYFLPIIVPLLILAGRGFYIGWPNPNRLVLLALVLVLAVGQAGWQAATPQKAQWREAADFIEEHRGDDEPVAVAPRWERDTLDYYLGSTDPMSVEQVRALIAREGDDRTITGFWVVFRSDQLETRRNLQEDLEGNFTGSKLDSVRSLQTWHFVGVGGDSGVDA